MPPRAPSDPLLAIASRLNLSIEVQRVQNFVRAPIGYRVTLYREPHGRSPLGLSRLMTGYVTTPTVTDVIRALGEQAMRAHALDTVEAWAAHHAVEVGPTARAAFYQDRREVALTRAFLGPRPYGQLIAAVRGDEAPLARRAPRPAPAPAVIDGEPVLRLPPDLGRQPPGGGEPADVIAAIAAGMLPLTDALADWVIALSDKQREHAQASPSFIMRSPDLTRATDLAYTFIGCPF